MSMLEALLGKDYYFIELLVDPAHAGHRGTARPRKYIICHHKAKARYLYDVHFAYETVTRAIQKTVQTRPRDYLVAAEAPDPRTRCSGRRSSTGTFANRCSGEPGTKFCCRTLGRRGIPVLQTFPDYLLN